MHQSSNGQSAREKISQARAEEASRVEWENQRMFLLGLVLIIVSTIVTYLTAAWLLSGWISWLHGHWWHLIPAMTFKQGIDAVSVPYLTVYVIMVITKRMTVRSVIRYLKSHRVN